MTNKDNLINIKRTIENEIERLYKDYSVQLQLKSIAEQSETKFIDKQSLIDIYDNQLNLLIKQLETYKNKCNMLTNLISNFESYQYAIDSMFYIFNISSFSEV